MEPEQIEEFLRLVSDGTRPDHAAREVGTTATKFRRLAKKDPEFGARYEEAKEEGRSDWHADFWVPTQEEQDEFIQYVEDGLTRDLAARELGYTGVQWRRFCKRDPEFNDRYLIARASGKEVYLEKLRSKVQGMALDGEIRILEKEAMARLPEWQPLLTRRVELANPEGQALTILAGQAKSLPDEELKALIDRLEKLEAEDLKQLPSGD